MRVKINNNNYYDGDLADFPKVTLANDPIGDELQADTMTVDIYYDDESECESPTSAKYGDPICLYSHGDALVSKQYVESVVRISRNIWRVTAISAVGLLTKRPHYGGVYNGIGAADLISDIIGNGISYTISEDVASEIIFNGHLPIGTARDNLHLVLQALGAGVFKDANGDMLIDFMQSTRVDVPDGEVYLEGSVEEGAAKATRIIVVEHAFFEAETDEVVTLFDNSDTGQPVSGQVVRFEDPCYGLEASAGLSISESNANYAVVTGVGTLTGRVYTHTQEERVLDTGADNEPLVLTEDANELINNANAQALADRIAGYYAGADMAETAVARSDLRTGQRIRFTNIYGAKADGYITEADVELSPGVDKSQLKVATNYTPGPFGSDYNAYLFIDTSGSWTVPGYLRDKRVRVITFGGTRGGQGGLKGQDGQSTTYGGTWGDQYPRSVRSEGGAGGEGGEGFMINSIDMILTQAQYNVLIGGGGLGGSSNGAEGSLGGNTTFGNITSASGVESTYYYNIIAQEYYGTKGESGIAGGYGGHGIDYDSGADVAEDGESITIDGVTYTGGYYGGGSAWDDDDRYYGAGGGGAAAGSNGGNATGDPIYAPSIKREGGAGANATLVPEQATGRCVGGTGGYGGGGGGGAGYRENFHGEHGFYVGINGTGGNGGRGGTGSNGFVLILYRKPRLSIEGILRALAHSISALRGRVSSALRGLMRATTESASSVVGVAGQIINATIPGISTGIGAVTGYAMSAVRGVLNGATNTLDRLTGRASRGRRGKANTESHSVTELVAQVIPRAVRGIINAITHSATASTGRTGTATSGTASGESESAGRSTGRATAALIGLLSGIAHAAGTATSAVASAARGIAQHISHAVSGSTGRTGAAGTGGTAGESESGGTASCDLWRLPYWQGNVLCIDNAVSATMDDDTLEVM